ncbi:hypothetical protein GCM10009733_080940 [Nonomuraea maheshkhaliensis]|uniref:rRNA methyltransferase n=1 Tax=Nonomuraea maheshkhaliensis TaxID=419590 RepID=A0ABN2GHQ0_9ACTN
MPYRHAVVRANYEDLASGGVLHSAPGFPAFPVRLASEMFQSALALRGGGPALVWDPCCGGGYLLTVVTLLHRRLVTGVMASDFDPEAVRLAERNLGLLTATGLAARAAELDERAERYDKPAYAAAALAAGRLARGLAAEGGDVRGFARQADVFDPDALRDALGGLRPGVVLTDVPYGEQTSWLGPGAAGGLGSLGSMVRALGRVLDDDAVIAVAVRGRKVPTDGGPRPHATYKIGTRTIALFRPAR